MKKTISILLLVTMAFSAWAQDRNQRNQNALCQKIIIDNRTTRHTPPAEGQMPVSVPIDGCEELYFISVLNGSQDMEPMPAKSTVDKQFTCYQMGGYTVDYNDCMRVKNAYDAVVVAEQAMFVAHQVAVNENSIKQSKAVAEAQQKGDVQNASLKAIEETNRKNAELYKQQAIVYTTAVAALGTTLATWQGKGKNGVKKFCNGKEDILKGALTTQGIKEDASGGLNCQSLMTKYKTSPKVYANTEMIGKFAIAAAGYAKKALDAKSKAGLSEGVADQIAKAPELNDNPQAEMDYCVLYPTAPECSQKNPNIRTPGSYSGSTVDFGGTGSSQAFNFNPEDAPILGDDGKPLGTDPENIADVSSPFEKEAKAANDILNPSSAASITPGSGAPAAGGGAGGGGGGGSASLGDDLAGATPDENKDPEIKTNKVSGKYKSGNGGGFQGVAKSKEEANPFASLFDAKGEGGGIEEDRSIASGDIDGQASGLFQKISNRYGQVQKDKRIYQNLE